MTILSGAQAVVETLKEYGAEILFGYIGHTTHDVAVAASQAGIRTVNPATELGGAYMAVAYNYMRNAPAAVGVWHTVGSLLIAPALREANSSRIPSVHLGFNADSRLTHRDGLQQVPSAMFDHVTRFNARIERVDKVGEIIHRAFQAAQGFPAGAAYVDITIDVAADRGDIVVPRAWRAPQLRIPPSAAAIAETAQLLREAKRPLLVIGGGAVRSDAGSEIVGLAEGLGIPFVTTTTAQGLIPDTHPLCLGPAGMAGWRCANDALKEADLLIVLGSRLSDWGISHGFTARLAPRMVQVDLDYGRLGEFYFPTVSIIADVRDFAASLSAAFADASDVKKLRSGRRDYLARAAESKAEWLSYMDTQCADNAVPVSGYRVMGELRGVMSPDDIIVSDIGRHSWYVLPTVLMQKPRKILMSFGEGLLGSAVPLGIGAKLAEPESTVFVATGDGGVQYHLNELRVAIEHGAPIVVIVFHDGVYGANEEMMRMKYGKGSWTTVPSPDYVQLFRAYGGDGERIACAEDVGFALRRAKASGKPYVIDVPTSPTAPFLDNHASGPVFLMGGRDIPADTAGTLMAGEHKGDRD